MQRVVGGGSQSCQQQDESSSILLFTDLVLQMTCRPCGNVEMWKCGVVNWLNILRLLLSLPAGLSLISFSASVVHLNKSFRLFYVHKSHFLYAHTILAWRLARDHNAAFLKATLQKLLKQVDFLLETVFFFFTD